MYQQAKIERSRRLRAASIALRKTAQTSISEARATIEECKRTCAALYQNYEPKVAISITTLLLALPASGEWTSGEGRYARLLNELFDAGSTLIEERLADDDEEGDLLWQVRLTNPRGIAERALCVGYAHTVAR
jgi:hypothetical protein